MHLVFSFFIKSSIISICSTSNNLAFIKANTSFRLEFNENRSFSGNASLASSLVNNSADQFNSAIISNCAAF